MANEASIIANPTATPAAVSTGYQAQNTRFIAQANGLDCSVVEGGAGQVTLKISGPVDVNGVLYSITADAVLVIGGGAGNYVIYLDGVGNTLTPTLTMTPGDFDPSKNAHYTVMGKRILDWLIQYDGVTAKVFKVGRDQWEDMLVANGTWTAPFSKVYEIWVTGRGGDSQNSGFNESTGGGGGGLTGKIRKFIEAGTVLTAVFSALSGGNTTFSDGVSLNLSAQNGTVGGVSGGGSNGGVGGTNNSGFDIVFNGGPGGYSVTAQGILGDGGNSFYGGMKHFNHQNANASPGNTYGAGATSATTAVGLGASGASGLIRIIG